MKIRTRLTLWYASVLFVSLLAMGVLAYHEFVVEPRNELRKNPGMKEPDPDEQDVSEAIGIVLWCGVPAALLALGGGWWLMHRVLAPVGALTRAAEAVDERNLGARLQRSGNRDELDRLTEVFNAMIARLENSFHRVREFTLHASHELKTPLTVLHGEMETELQDEQLPAAQRERLLSQMDEVRRLSKIVDGLTLLTKVGAGEVPLELEPLQLEELVRDACDDAQILARPYSVQVRLGSCEPIALRGDRHRLRQLLLNLTDNAVKYNQPGGTVDIELRRAESGGARFTIANTGPGIPEKLAERVFEPFFRGDPSHNNGVEGCGLGLCIARWIVTAHGGTIEFKSQPAEVTRVVVLLPADVPA